MSKENKSKFKKMTTRLSAASILGVGYMLGGPIGFFAAAAVLGTGTGIYKAIQSYKNEGIVSDVFKKVQGLFGKNEQNLEQTSDEGIELQEITRTEKRSKVGQPTEKSRQSAHEENRHTAHKEEQSVELSSCSESEKTPPKKLTPEDYIVKSFLDAVKSEDIKGAFKDGKLHFNNQKDASSFMKQQAEEGQKFHMKDDNGNLYVSNGAGFYYSGPADKEKYQEAKARWEKEQRANPTAQSEEDNHGHDLESMSSTSNSSLQQDRQARLN